jgi:hypothetical protein
MWHVPGRREMHTYKVLMGKDEETALNLGTDGRIILKHILRK